MNSPEPLISDEEYRAILKDGNTKPGPAVGKLFNERANDLSVHAAKTVQKAADAANWRRLLLVLAGHPELIRGWDSIDELERGVVEYCHFYAGVVLDYAEEDIKSIALELIQSSPVSEYDPSGWRDADDAEQRVAMRYRQIESASRHDIMDNTSKIKQFTPQNLGKADTAGYTSAYDQRAQETRRDLLGR